MAKRCRPSPKVKRAARLLATSSSKRTKKWAGIILVEHKNRVH